ncbi:MAG: hypothetical protein EA353_00400 [Puniceicoccaceae bacterium]|nr:MAG: hypothetical protein EA353_00400 [Puniceicoccaceae bacterium]
MKKTQIRRTERTLAATMTIVNAPFTPLGFYPVLGGVAVLTEIPSLTVTPLAAATLAFMGYGYILYVLTCCLAIRGADLEGGQAYHLWRGNAIFNVVPAGFGIWIMYTNGPFFFGVLLLLWNLGLVNACGLMAWAVKGKKPT